MKRPCAKRRPAALVLAALAAACSPVSGGEELRVAAASSMGPLLAEAAPRFEEEHPGLRLLVSLDASSTLARQVLAGARFDVFLSADAPTLDRVEEALVPGTRTVFLANRLALVARAELGAAPARPAELTGISGTIALAGPEVPAGRYAREYLAAAGLLAELEPRFVVAKDVRAALALVENEAADYAFVYATDARSARRARTLWSAPPGEGPAVVYEAAVVAGGDPRGSRLVEWLSGPGFRELARSHGFLPPPR